MKDSQITFFDIDETLFFTGTKGAMIKIKVNDKTIKRIGNQEYNTYVLKDGESFDFTEFISTEVFTKTTTPNKVMIKKIRELYNKSKQGTSEVYILTARSDFDNPEKFLKYMKDNGIEVGHKKEGKIHIIRAGNIPGLDNAHKKAVIIKRKLQSGNFNTVRFYDDAQSNIDAFNELRKEFKDIKFKSFLI